MLVAKYHLLLQMMYQLVAVISATAAPSLLTQITEPRNNKMAKNLSDEDLHVGIS